MKFRFTLILAFLLLSCRGEFTLTDRAGGGTSTPGSALTFTGISSIDNVSSTSVRLNWTHVSGAQFYQILNVSSGTPVWIANVTAPTATYTITGLSASTLYKYRVRLTDSQGLSDSNTNDISVTTAAVAVTHNGWTLIKAVGPKTPAAQGSDLGTAVASVTLSWNALTVVPGVVASYNIYRASASGTQNYSAPLASGIAAGTASYTDSTVVAGNTYYYTIAPVVGGTVYFPSAAADSEVKVIVPKDNMVLVHRWSANQEMCGQMGKAVDRANNYRCAVSTGANSPPGTGGSGYMDLGSSLFVDAYEQGCNYTYDSVVNKCGSANGCIGTLSTPNGAVTGNNGDIYYSRQNGTCYINTSAGSGTTWTTANSATNSQMQSMASAAPGLPPFALISQTNSAVVCSGQTVSGFAGTKRLLKRKEQVLAAAWDSSLNDATINSIEIGSNLDTTGYCNSSSASPQGSATTDISGTNPTIAFDNLAVPTAKDTLPGCRFGDCASTASTIRSLRTGSVATRNCVSRYGVQDLSGNLWEWTSDQITCNGATCSGVVAASNTADTSNDDFSGIAFDGNQGPTASRNFDTSGKIQFPVGIPIVGAGFTGDGTVTRTVAQLHDDYLAIGVGAGTYGTLIGGGFDSTSNSGRFNMALGETTSTIYRKYGFRCAIPAE